MNGRWTASNELTRCGFGEGHDVKPDVPVYVMAGKLVRCEQHAPAHALADATAIERVCVEVEARRATPVPADGPATAPSAPSPELSSFATTVAPERMQRALARRGIRMPAPKKPQPFATVAGVRDPKSEAFNR
jgi:hypothetical protein